MTTCSLVQLPKNRPDNSIPKRWTIEIETCNTRILLLAQDLRVEGVDCPPLNGTAFVRRAVEVVTGRARTVRAFDMIHQFTDFGLRMNFFPEKNMTGKATVGWHSKGHSPTVNTEDDSSFRTLSKCANFLLPFFQPVEARVVALPGADDNQRQLWTVLFVCQKLI